MPIYLSCLGRAGAFFPSRKSVFGATVNGVEGARGQSCVRNRIKRVAPIRRVCGGREGGKPAQIRNKTQVYSHRGFEPATVRPASCALTRSAASSGSRRKLPMSATNAGACRAPRKNVLKSTISVPVERQAGPARVTIRLFHKGRASWPLRGNHAKTRVAEIK